MSTHTIEEVSSTKRRINITVPASDVQKQWNKVVQDIQSSAAIRGFRKGKAPLSLVKSIYAKEILDKVLDTLVNDSYKSAIKEEKLQVISQPKLENESQFNENVDFSFSAVVEVFKQIEIHDYKGLSVTLPAELSPSAEEEAAEKTLKAENEHRETCTDHHHAHEPVTEDFEKHVKAQVHAYFEQARAQKAFELIVPQILEKNPFDVADALVERMIDQRIVKQNVQDGKDPGDGSLKNQALRDQHRDDAVKTVKGILALTQIAQQEKITVPFSDVVQSLTHQLQHMNYQQLRQNQSEIIQERQTELTIEKTIKFLLENGQVNWEEKKEEAKSV